MATLAAGDYYLVQQPVEGNRIADLNWGTAQGQYAVLTFAARSNIPDRMFCVALRNSPVTHSLVFGTFFTDPTSFTWQKYSLVVPPPPVGTWAVNISVGLYLSFVLACGTTFQTATTGSWVSGNRLGTSVIGSTYGWSSYLYVADVGLYLDPNKTGVAPPYAIPHYEDDLADCQRYCYRAYGARGVVSATTTANRLTQTHPVPMVGPPGLILGGTALRAYDGSTTPAVSAIANQGSSAQHAEFSATTSGLVVGRAAGVLVDSIVTNYVTVTARY